MEPALEAIRGHRSAHSLATGPLMAEPAKPVSGACERTGGQGECQTFGQAVCSVEWQSAFMHASTVLLPHCEPQSSASVAANRQHQTQRSLAPATIACVPLSKLGALLQHNFGDRTYNTAAPS
jgi:hypothetical protein